LLQLKMHLARNARRRTAVDACSRRADDAAKTDVSSASSMKHLEIAQTENDLNAGVRSGVTKRQAIRDLRPPARRSLSGHKNAGAAMAPACFLILTINEVAPAGSILHAVLVVAGLARQPT